MKCYIPRFNGSDRSNVSDYDDAVFRDQLQREEEKSREAERRAMTPKPDPLESDARAELRQAQNRKESGVTPENPTIDVDPDRKQMLESHRELRNPGSSVRDRFIVPMVGKFVELHIRNRQAPKLEGRLIEYDTQFGYLFVETYAQSPPDLEIVQISDLVKVKVKEYGGDHARKDGRR